MNTNRFIRRALTVYLACVFIQTAVRADDGFSRFTSFFSPGNSASYGLSLEPDAKSSPQVLTQTMRGSAIVSKADADTWAITGRADHSGLTHSPVIPATGALFPDSLWNVQGGGAYLHRIDERRQWGMNVGVGSASDEPFRYLHETELQATASITLPSGPTDSWIFLLTYSNNRTFANGVPLPGFAYVSRSPDKGLTVVAGFPFVFVNYTPNKDWSTRATVFGPSSQSVEVSRRVSGPVRAYASLDHGAQSWFRATRETRSDRLIYEERKAVLGVRAPIVEDVSLDLSGGRTFGRRLFEAKDVRSADASKIHLEDGWIVSATVSARWGRTDGSKQN